MVSHFRHGYEVLWWMETNWTETCAFFCQIFCRFSCYCWKPRKRRMKSDAERERTAEYNAWGKALQSSCHLSGLTLEKCDSNPLSVALCNLLTVKAFKIEEYATAPTMIDDSLLSLWTWRHQLLYLWWCEMARSLSINQSIFICTDVSKHLHK